MPVKLKASQTIFEKLGQTIRLHRKASGLNQANLALLAGVGKTAVFDIEKGKASVRFDTLYRVCNALNIRFEFIGPLSPHKINVRGG